MLRVPDLVLEALSPEQRRVYDTIAAGPRGGVQGPLRVWLHSSELADRAQALGAFCRFETCLPARLTELAILVIGAFWQARFEWHAHAPLAIAAGLDPAAVEAMRVGQTPQFLEPDETVVYGFARELTTTHQVAEASYQRAIDILGVKGVVELVGILGYYTLVAMTLNVFEVPLPKNTADPFATA
jgi:4-carboxymuconolactone decarboxylase